MGGNLKFRDQEAYNKFVKALETVYNEGRMIKVDGVSAINTNMKDGDMVCPFMVETQPNEVIIGPSVETISVTIDIIGGQKNVEIQRYHTKNDVICQTKEDEIVFLKFSFSKDSHNVQFTYRMQVQFAKSVKDVEESYCTAIGILNFFFKPEHKQNAFKDLEMVHTIKKSFQLMCSFWEKLSLIEDELGLSFDPIKVGNMDDHIQDVEELYLLLIKKEAVRVNAKLTSIESTGITLESKDKTLKIGQEIGLTFTSKTSYSIAEEDITIYTANLLSNARIKEIVEDEEGATKILYDGTDSMPMYISCTGHKTSAESEAENSLIMRDKARTQKYKGAWTVNEHYRRELNE